MRLQTHSERAAVLMAAVILPLPVHDHHHHHHRHQADRARHHRSIAASRAHQPPAARPHHRHRTLNAAASATLSATISRPPARAHVAGDPGDVISDFKFAPATLTVHVGDSITWTNDGPSPHSATANNGSFDTGVLKKGQSGSHTFTQAGTFSYFCSVHPFMHGTVVVVADTSSAGSGQGSGSTSGSTSPSGAGGSGGGGSTAGSTGGAGASTQAGTAASSQPTLPLTGIDSIRTVLIGLALAAVGLSIRGRRRTRR